MEGSSWIWIRGAYWKASKICQDLPDDLAGRALTLNDLPWLRAQGIDLEVRDGTVTLVDCSVAVMSSTTFDRAETRDVLMEAANARLTVDSIGSDAVVLRERDTSGPLDPQEAILRAARSASPYFKTDCPNPDLPLLTRLDDHAATYAIQLQSGRTGLLYHLGLVAEDLVQVQYKLVASSPQFRATFANGVTVELLGLSYSPPDQQGWWSPAGSPLREAPPALLKAFPKTGERGYSLSVRFAGIGGRKISASLALSVGERRTAEDFAPLNPGYPRAEVRLSTWMAALMNSSSPWGWHRTRRSSIVTYTLASVTGTGKKNTALKQTDQTTV